MSTSKEVMTNIQPLCDKIAQEIKPNPKRSISCSRLLPVLKKSFYGTRELFRKAASFEEKNSELSDALCWLTDNYSFIEEEFSASLALLKKEKSRPTEQGLPYCFAVSEKLFEIYESKLCDDSLRALVSSCDRNLPHGLDIAELAAFPLLIKSAVLCQIGKLCCAVSEKSGFTDSKEDGARLICAIKSLKFLTVCDFDTAFSESFLEKLLNADPSGAYPQMTAESKNALKHSLHLSARAKKLHDCEYAQTLLEKSADALTENERYIGHPIRENHTISKLYFPLLHTLSALLTLLFGLVSSPFLMPVLFFPVFESVKLICDTLFSRFCKSPGILPSIDIKSIPDDGRTLCVITALLSGKEHDVELFSRLERIRNANCTKNLKFGLLCDLPDSESAVSAVDSEIISYASGRIDSLNSKYGDEFILFIRPRSYSKSEKKFMAYERKRGAVIELTKLIKTGISSFDTMASGFSKNADFLKGVKYIITLDADTNLGLDGAIRLVGKMLHPANKAVIDRKNHIVTSGYGILQPKMVPDLDSARATPFTRLLCGGGGTDIYSGASFDIYQALFLGGIFCGKGIIDVDAFYESVSCAGFFPDDTVLSHDILEGERARTALLCDTELTDGFPKNELSYIKRKHRWIRGDIQNLVFLKKHFKVGEKSRKNDLSRLSKYKLYDNVRRVFTPVFSFALIPLSLLFDKAFSPLLFFIAFAPCIIPFVIEFINIIRNLSFKSAARRFFSMGVTVGIWQSFLRMLFFGCMLAKDAFLSAQASLLSLYRMVFSKRKLLEWVTAAQSDSGKPTLVLFITKHLVSALAGVMIFIFAPGGMIRFSGLAFFIMPIIGFITSKDRIVKSSVSKKDKKIMRAYAADIWKFFDENVTQRERHLPPDNLQLSPYEKTAHRTSPTNIGLYLAGVLAARDFGFIDTKETVARISATISTVEKLPKWNGNLFNWYDTRSLAVLTPKYISSVDSGNFVACLITLANGLAEYSGEDAQVVDLIGRIKKLIDNTDLRPLYNEKRNLFRVGITVTDEKAISDDGCYDFLMSESRILSYIACATRTVRPEHWKRLARPLVSERGYIGLSSWSGTAFEFFMPNLFMPVKKSSLLYEATLFAYRSQSTRRANGVWGISESGFFAFDCDLNYQYKAFGVPSLGKAAGLEQELVISPYSSFLALCVSVKGCLANLLSLEKLKAYGKYGFYEALDFTPPRVKRGHACIKSYMSHHLGMSMLALSNACFDNNFVSRFMQDPKMQAGSALLEEKIPVNAIIRKLKKSSLPDIRRDTKPFSDTVHVDGFSMASPVCACVSDGKLSCTVSDCGHVEAKKGDIGLFLSSHEKFPDAEIASLFCYLSLDGRIYGMTPLSRGICPDSTFSFSYTECSATHSLSCDKGDFSLSYTVSPDHSSVMRVKLSGKTSASKGAFRFVFTPSVVSDSAYAAHPAFSELFIESEYDKADKILYFHRRARSASEQDSILAVSLCDTNAEPVFSTQKKFGEYDKYSYFSDDIDNKCGACINPHCVIGADFQDDCTSELLLVMTHSKAFAKEAITLARRLSFSAAEKALSEAASQFTLGAGISSVSGDGIVRAMLSGTQFSGGASQKSLLKYGIDKLFSDGCPDISINSLWKHGISGDNRLAVIDTGAYLFRTGLEKRIRAFKLLAMKNKLFDLIILYSESDKYERRLEKRLRKLISDSGADGFLERKKGGIRLIEKNSAADDLTAIISAASFIDDLFSEKLQDERKESIVFAEPISRGKNLDGSIVDGFAVAGGKFTDNAFIIDKYSKNAPKAPFAHILSGENISCVVTQDSLGYTFVKNASECRITPIPSGGYSQCEGERLYYKENGKLFDLLKCAMRVKYSCGKAEYFGKVSSCEYRICVFTSHKLPAKAVGIAFSGTIPENASVSYCVQGCMGNKSIKNVYKAKDDSAVFFKNPLSGTMGKMTGHLTVFSSEKTYALCDKAAFLSFGKQQAENCDFACVGSKITSGKKIVFVLGASKNETVYDKIKEAFIGGDYNQLLDAEKFCSGLIPKLRFSHVRADDKRESLEKMFNLFLPYDAVFSRFMARAGFYQSGGAYGFRDQLQDSLCLLYSDKCRALSHIHRAASHQFPEGDVLHWWHPQTRSGVRTRCSDDYLWLVYTCLEYLKASGNDTFFNTPLPYISAEKLDKTTYERYGAYSVSDLWESLYRHNIRALDRAISLRGGHGLCLMGTCDWCDGYSAVGKEMSGESTFTTMFLIMLLEGFLPLCRKFSDKEHEEEYRKIIPDLKKAVTEHCFDKNTGYFIRGFYDDGQRLGAPECDEGKIDLMAQSFCALSGIDDKLCTSALVNARNELYDEEYGIMKLLSPPFDKTEQEPGYIKGYLAGVRENGGQYTHGALFYALACFEMAEKYFEKEPELSAKLTKYGEDILLFSNPAFRSSQGAPDIIREAYRTEPYSVAADIYSCKDHPGRGGWTHYTGACGWMWRLMLRYVFGITFSELDTDSPYITINPKRHFPMAQTISGGTLKISEFGFDLTIEYTADGKKCLFADRKPSDGKRIGRDVRIVTVHI